MLRSDRLYQLSGRPERDDMTVIHNCDSLTQALCLIHVMSGEHNGPTRCPEFLDESPQLPPRLRIESGRRLVEKEQLRVSDESTRDGAHSVSEVHRGGRERMR